MAPQDLEGKTANAPTRSHSVESGGYGELISRCYDQVWGSFSRKVAPLIHSLYEEEVKTKERRLLDLGCGTGTAALHFLERGFQVVGVDASRHMLELARAKTEAFLNRGQLELVNAGIDRFPASRGYDLAVATYGVLNHLKEKDIPVLFMRLFQEVSDSGLLAFDVFTKRGLRDWDYRGDFACSGDFARIERYFDTVRDLGCTSLSWGTERELLYNNSFSLDFVDGALRGSGWKSVRYLSLYQPGEPVLRPEDEPRVLIVAAKQLI